MDSSDDLALLQSLLADLLADLRADSGTVHAIGADGALHLRCAIGIPEPVLAIVAVVPIGKGMAGLAAERGCAVNSCNLQQDTTGDVRPGARATGLAGSVAVPVLSASVDNPCMRRFTMERRSLRQLMDLCGVPRQGIWADAR